jgi:hypothetical protein
MAAPRSGAAVDGVSVFHTGLVSLIDTGAAIVFVFWYALRLGW